MGTSDRGRPGQPQRKNPPPARTTTPVRPVSAAKQRRIDAQRRRELANLGRRPEERPDAVARARRAGRRADHEPVQRDDLGFIIRRGPDGVMYREDPGEAARNWWRKVQAHDAEAERQTLLAGMATLPKKAKSERRRRDG